MQAVPAVNLQNAASLVITISRRIAAQFLPLIHETVQVFNRVKIKWKGTVTSSSAQFYHTTAPTSQQYISEELLMALIR